MKLTIPVLAVAALFQSTSTLAGDVFVVSNVHKADGSWKALATWFRGENPGIAIDADAACFSGWMVPYPDVNQICWDWTLHRGHIMVGSNKHCFKRKREWVIHADRVWHSEWTTEDCATY